MVSPIVPLLPLLWCDEYWAGVNPVQFLENFHKHSAELSWFLLALIFSRLWEFTPKITKDVPLRFPVVPHKDGIRSYHLEVGPFLVNFGFPSITVQFMRADEELG